jgi:hypothetical protein
LLNYHLKPRRFISEFTMKEIPEKPSWFDRFQNQEGLSQSSQ